METKDGIIFILSHFSTFWPKSCVSVKSERRASRSALLTCWFWVMRMGEPFPRRAHCLCSPMTRCCSSTSSTFPAVLRSAYPWFSLCCCPRVTRGRVVTGTGALVAAGRRGELQCFKLHQFAGGSRSASPSRSF